MGKPKQNLTLLNQLKSLYKSKAKKAKVDVSKRDHIVIYPEVPSEAMIRECYDADDPPVTSTASSTGILDCLRKSSSKTKPETALVPMPAPAVQSPTMPSGVGPSSMQQAMAQQAMAFMGMDPMAAMNMMQMMAMRFLGQSQQQDTVPAGLKIFAGNKTELNQVTPNRSPSAPSSAASPPAVVTPQVESQEDSQGQELQLAWPKKVSSKGTTGIKAVEKHKEGHLSCSASAGLSLYYSVRCFLQTKVPQSPAGSTASKAVRRYYCLAAVLDLLVKTRTGAVLPVEP